MASPNISEIMTTTLESRTKKVADNVTENNAILRKLNQRGKVKPFSGGRVIYQELEYAENSTYKRYSGYEQLDISPSDVFTAAEFDIKQSAVAVSISGLEQLQNAGPEQMIDLLESRISNAERTMQNKMSEDMYSDGTADGGKQTGGLQHLVADSPTSGTVGGINRATWTFWRNIVGSGTTMTSSNAYQLMLNVWLQLSRGTDRPDLIIADNNHYSLYAQHLEANQRFMKEDEAMAGFMSLMFQDAPVVFDGGYGGNAPADHMYFLNCDFIHYRPHRDRNMVPLNPDRFATNQDAVVKLMAWAGNMTLSNAFLQGVLIN